MKDVLVLNPNSSPLVTTAIAEAVRACLPAGGFTVEQLDDGPPAIEDAATAALAAPLVVDRIRARAGQYRTFVVACHGDPGVDAARVALEKPILGIGESSYLSAVRTSARFGVITLGDDLVARKWQQIRALGLEHHCAAVEPSRTGVHHGVVEDADFAPYVDAGRRALMRGAELLVLACAGMVRAAKIVERELDVPVIEPIVATISSLPIPA